MFAINKYALIAVIVIAVSLVFITKLIVETIRYAIRKQNKNIKTCIGNDISYKEKMKQYNKKLKDAGIVSKKERDKLLKILEALHK